MSTHANIHFTKGNQHVCMLHLYSDGYPRMECGVFPSWKKFLRELKKEEDNGDLPYPLHHYLNHADVLAATFCCWLVMNDRLVGVQHAPNQSVAYTYYVNVERTNGAGAPEIWCQDEEEAEEKADLEDIGA